MMNPEKSLAEARAERELLAPPQTPVLQNRKLRRALASRRRQLAKPAKARL